MALTKTRILFTVALVSSAVPLAGASDERWETALERSAVVFGRPNGGPCVKYLDWRNTKIERKFTTGRPEYVMPVGAGNLSAMVSFGENRWELHLSQADYLAKSDGTPYDGTFRNEPELRSPGHVTVIFDSLKTNEIVRFEQKMDLLRGRVILALQTAKGEVSGSVFGDRSTGALVILVKDTRRGVVMPQLEWSGKSPTLKVEKAFAKDVLKVAIGKGAAAQKALAASSASQVDACRAWWRDYWSKGWIELTGDHRAERLERLWYANLYVWASVGCGPVPPKFNGGPGIVFDDCRCWGRNVWWQNTREMIWPMSGANRSWLAKSYLEFYGNCHANFSAGPTRKLPATGEMTMKETFEITDSPVFAKRNAPARSHSAPYVEPTDAERRAAREERIARRGTHTSHVHSSGTELLMQMVDYIRFTGDRSMLTHVATFLRSQTELYLKLMEKGEDGKYHICCSNVNESWIKADDGIVDLASARWLFSQTAAHGQEFGFPENLIEAARVRKDRIADYPHGPAFSKPYSPAGLVIGEGPDVYYPCVITNGMRKANYENNELYLVHPFVMAKVDDEGPLRERMINTYRKGLYVEGGSGWTPVAVAVARMRLENAAQVVFHHSMSCCWPFGGGNSPGLRLYNESKCCDTAYMDTTGVMQTGVQELLLQSHAEEPDASFFTGGVIRLAPCVPKTWSGAFKLRARGGFLIEASFKKGKVTQAEVESEFGNDFVWVDPSTGERKVRKTEKGQRFEIEL